MEKHFLLALLIALSNLSPCFSQDLSVEGYKSAKWGMSQNEVKASFPGMEFQSKENILYSVADLGDQPVNMAFLFTRNDKLCRVIINFIIHTSNKEKFMSEFQSIEALLKEKYGPPKDTLRNGSTNKYISDIDAIATGKGAYQTTWTTPESSIWLNLSGDNYTVGLRLYYESNTLIKQYFSENKTKIKDNL